MEIEVNQLHQHIGRSKLAIFAVVGFLALVTYLMITLSSQLANTSVTTDSNAQMRRDGQIRRNGATLPTPPTDAPPVACGEVCGFSHAPGTWERPCAAGSTCKWYGIGAGGVGYCVSQGGGSCPLPMVACGDGCSDQDGNETRRCPSGTTCTEGGFLGFKACKPDSTSGMCPGFRLVANPSPIEAQPALPVVGCGQVCITRETNRSQRTVATCAAGLTCQDIAGGGSYMAPSYCYPAGSNGQCPLNVSGGGGGSTLPVEPTGGMPQ